MHSSAMLTATVVICTYNRAGPLRNALASVMVQVLPGDRAFEIVLVDDGSSDDTAAAVRYVEPLSPVPIRYVRISHGGVAAARNAGVQQSRGEWVAFFDDDQEAEPGWLAGLVRRAEDAGADCVAGRIIVTLIGAPDGMRLDPTVLKLLGDNGFMASAPAMPGAANSGVVPGTGNALVHRSLFDRVGPFDVGLTYGEDAEWFRRARRSGARIVFAADAVIRHLTPPSRLTSNYLFAVAARGAASRAADDLKDGGAPALVRNSLLRTMHVCMMAARLALARLTGDHASALGRDCSIRYSLTYVATAATLLARRPRTIAPAVEPGYR